MTSPTRKWTGCWFVQLRSDLSREQALAYWRGAHARIVTRIPGVVEYRQLHFSADDHGFWPELPGATTAIFPDWRLDGVGELGYGRAIPAVGTLSASLRYVFPDEANAFDRTLAHLTGPGGGQWFSGEHRPEARERAMVLLRRRPSIRARAFRAFVNDQLRPALAGAPGILELRTYAFLPYSALAWPSPGVEHHIPPNRRYQAAVVLGAADRASLDSILRSPSLTATREAQASHCLALHAYRVEDTVMVIQDGRSVLPDTW
jgi:hypothetical protein